MAENHSECLYRLVDALPLYPEIETQALMKISAALKKGGKLYIDGGSRLKEISLEKLLI